MVGRVRRAETLKSLDELGLSKRTKSYLEKNIGSVDEIVSEGRYHAFEQDLGIQSREKAPKWKTELIPALKDAGFIRPVTDFIVTFRINALHRIFGGRKEEFPTSIGQLSNEQYENFRSLPDEYVKAVKFSLLERLQQREYAVLRLRFGLDDGRSRDHEAVGRSLGITRERVRQLEAKALKKLINSKTKLPAPPPIA